MLFGLVGGLGLFLYGMKIMGDGLQKAAGERMRRLLEVLTTNPLMGVLVGTGVTAIIQSSSATTVMVVGFVNAGLMTLRQAIGVIMGANIGTTMTAQLIAFKLETYALPAIAIGVLMSFFARSKGYKYGGQIILGFGILFLGLTTMSKAMTPLREAPAFVSLMTGIGRNPLLGVLIGFAFTSIVQSSSATIGVLQALAGMGLVNIGVALPILFGENIGTCVTALLSSIGTNVAARRAALVHFLFNLLGTVVFVLLLPVVAGLVTRTSGDVVRQIANAHTLFNVTNTIIQLPLIGFLGALVTKLIPGQDVTFERGAKYLDRRLLSTPSIALGQAVKELLRMGNLARESITDTLSAFVKEDAGLVRLVRQREEVINDLQHEITNYLVDLAQQALTPEQSHKLNGLLNIVNDIERVGDHLENIIEFTEEKIESKLPFSSYAIEELEYMFGKVGNLFTAALQAFEREDRAAAKDLMRFEEEVDQMEKDLRKSHILRLHEGKCYTASGVVFIDVISNLERIGDHATGIANALLEEM